VVQVVYEPAKLLTWRILPLLKNWWKFRIKWGVKSFDIQKRPDASERVYVGWRQRLLARFVADGTEYRMQGNNSIKEGNKQADGECGRKLGSKVKMVGSRPPSNAPASI